MREGVLIIVPAWNEAASVGAVVHEVAAALPDADVLVVDDGSTDDTARAAADAGAAVVRLPFNLGVGGAMRAGYRWAHRHGYTAAVQVDADGQHDPTEIAALLEQLRDADLVVGARFAGKGAYEVSRLRRIAMWFLARAVSRLVGATITDATSGFRAAGPAAIRLFADTYPVEYLGDTVESLVIAGRAGLKVGQVPVNMRLRQSGMPSQSPLRASLYLLRAGVILVLAATRRDVTGGGT